MDSKSAAQQQGPAAMPQKAAGQQGVVLVQPVRFPASPGVCVAGSTAKGLYRIVRAADMESRMGYLQSRTPFPLEVAAWLPGSFGDSLRQAGRLRYFFSAKRKGGGWYALSARDIAKACDYLTEEKNSLVRAQEKEAKAREDALEGCLQLISRIRTLAEVVRWSLDRERRTARAAWPQQQKTDEFLQLVDRFHAIAGRFDTALSRWAMEIQLARMPKDDAALSGL